MKPHHLPIFPPSWLLGLLAFPSVHDVSNNATQHPHHHLVGCAFNSYHTDMSTLLSSLDRGLWPLRKATSEAAEEGRQGKQHHTRGHKEGVCR